MARGLTGNSRDRKRGRAVHEKRDGKAPAPRAEAVEPSASAAGAPCAVVPTITTGAAPATGAPGSAPAAGATRATGSARAAGATGAAGAARTPGSPETEGRQGWRCRGAAALAGAARDRVVRKDFRAAPILDALLAVVDVVLVLVAAVGDRLADVHAVVALALRSGRTLLRTLAEAVAVRTAAASVRDDEDRRGHRHPNHAIHPRSPIGVQAYGACLWTCPRRRWRKRHRPVVPRSPPAWRGKSHPMGRHIRPGSIRARPGRGKALRRSLRRLERG